MFCDAPGSVTLPFGVIGRQCSVTLPFGVIGRQCSVTLPFGVIGRQCSVTLPFGVIGRQCSVTLPFGIIGRQCSVTLPFGVIGRQCSVTLPFGVIGRQCSVTLPFGVIGRQCSSLLFLRECSNLQDPSLHSTYRIRSNYRTYKRRVKKLSSLQITASVLFLHFFIEVYVVGTHLSCIQMSTHNICLYKEKQKQSNNQHQTSPLLIFL